MIAKHAALISAAVIAGTSGPALSEALKVADAPFVATFLVKKKDDMSFDAFRAHQLHTHVPLALKLPGLRGYRLTFYPPNDGMRQAVDAIAQVTFADAAAYEAAMASPQGQRALADLPNMLDMDAVTVLTAGTGDQYAGELEPE